MKLKSTVFVSSIRDVFANKKSTDVEFVLKTRSGKTAKIPAHKLILSSASPVFEKMFYGDLAEGPTVDIVDVCAESFSEFLQFFYLTKVQLSADNIAEVLILIDKYDVPKCVAICETFLQSTVTIARVFHYYELALSYNLSKNTAKHFEDLIAKNTTESLGTTAFIESNEITLRSILKTNKLKCSEMRVFQTVTLWAKESLSRKGMDVNAVNIRAELGDAFNLIRFPVMTPTQFLSILKKYPNLLTSDEHLNILQYMVAKRPLTEAKHFNCTPRKRRDPAKKKKNSARKKKMAASAIRSFVESKIRRHSLEKKYFRFYDGDALSSNFSNRQSIWANQLI